MPLNIENQRKIDINELPKEIPDFTSTYEPKDSLIKKWIINWILSAVKNNKIKENDILPKKSDISNYLGVSVGTVQNAIRYVEDEGFLKSKQKKGTLISNFTNPVTNTTKSTSKRDKVILAIKKHILTNNYKIGKSIPSARKMSEILSVSQNTTRLAYEYLMREGIIDSRQTRGNDSNWILKRLPEDTNQNYFNIDNFKTDTLVSKLTGDIKIYLCNKCAIGDKIPTHEQLAQIFNVSIKTIHDCISILNDEGIVITRRGKYGTIFAKNPFDKSFNELKENSIFANANDVYFYNYKKIESKIISLIKSQYKPGDKLPSMLDLSLKFDVSTNTIRKAMSSLAQQGFITFGRGRFGGTFLLETPYEPERQPYQWLSINPEFNKF